MSSIKGGTRRMPQWSVRGLRPSTPLRDWLFVSLTIAWVLLGVGPGPLQDAQAQSRDGDIRHIVVTLYKSRTLMLPQPFASAVVGSPELVDALPMSDHRLYIQGKKIGTTNVSVFDQSMRLMSVIDVEVALDTGNLQEKIRASTGSSGIHVGSSNGQIVLSGLVSNSVAADRAVEVAKTMMPEGGIVNAMTVAPAQQVMLRVRFLEVARSASREIGVNWNRRKQRGKPWLRDRPGDGLRGGPTCCGPFSDRFRLRDAALCRRERKPGNQCGRPSDIQYFGDFGPCDRRCGCGAFWRRDSQPCQQGGQPRRYSVRTGNERPRPTPGRAGLGCTLR